MKNIGFGKRLLTMLLVVTMLLSIVPVEVFSEDGDFATTGETGLVGDISTADTINWPIKIYDYLNDGMLFEYSSALHTAAYAPEGAAYGGGTLMPTTDIIGNDYTFYYSGQKRWEESSSTYVDPYKEYSYTYWLPHTEFYSDSSSKGGYSETGKLKYLHLALKTADANGDTIPYVISDFYSDNTTAGYARDKVQYAVVVYRTNIADGSGARINMGWATNISGGGKYSTGGTYRVPKNWPAEYMEYIYRGTVPLTADQQWHAVVIPMNAGTIGTNWSSIEKVYTVLLDVVGMDVTTEYLDISHVAYFSTEAEASNYGDDAVAFVNDPGEYLLDQTYTTETISSVPDPDESAYAIDFPENANYFTSSTSPYVGWGTSAGRDQTADGKDYATLNMDTANAGTNGGAHSAYFATDLGLSSTAARYITIVYRTHSVASSAQIGFWVEGSKADGNATMAGGYYQSRRWGKMVTLPRSEDEWISITYDLSWIALADPDYSNVTTYTNIGAYLPTSGTLDIAYVDYDPTLADAHAFAEDAVNYMNGNTTMFAAPSPSAYAFDFVNDRYEDTATQNWATSTAYTTAMNVQDIETTNKGYLSLNDVDNDGAYDAAYILSGVTLAKTDVRYVTIVYRTHNLSGVNTIGFWVDGTKSNGSTTCAGKATSRIDQYVTLTEFPLSETEWTYKTFDLQTLITTNDSDYNSISRVTAIGAYLPGFTDPTQILDIAYIDYHRTQGAGEAFGEAAANYMNSGSTSSSSGGTYTKHWNMGGNSAFTMLLPSGGGGWSDDNIRGGENDWDNGYFTYSIGITDVEVYDSAGMEIYNRYWDFDDDRDTAAAMGYVVSDDIFTLQPATSISTKDLDLGYHLYNTAVKGPYTIGLLESGLTTVTKDDQSYKILQYKNDTIDYIAQLLEATLQIPQRDQYGNYNYTFVQGSKSDQFAYTYDGTAAVPGVDGETKVDLATALRKRLGISFENTEYKGGQVLSSAVTIASRGKASDLSSTERAALIGSFEDCLPEIDTFAAAAYYLLHNLFVDNSYNQLQNDFNYLQLSKATIADGDTDDTNDKKAYVFDAGFTTGNATYVYDTTHGYYKDANGNEVEDSVVEAYLAASDSGVDYSPLVKKDGSAGTGIISLVGATTKDEIYYSGRSSTTRFPFLPIVDATGDYEGKTPTYFAEDQADSVLPEGAGYADRNYNYVMQANGEFIYHYQDSLFFEFAGDDDVYLFVNDELVLDIGAAHSITNVKFDMNDYVLAAQGILGDLSGYSAGMTDEAFSELLVSLAITENEPYSISSGDYAGTYTASELKRWHKLNLVDGESYDIDFYYMERHGWGANMRVVTNIVMTDPALGCDKTAYQNGTEISYGGIVEKTAPIEYSFALTNNGNSKLYNLTFDDHDIGVTLDPENGLTVATGFQVFDASGSTLDAADLVAYVDGFYEDGSAYETIKVTFADNDALKAFLEDLTGPGLQSGEGSDSDQSGGGLWKGSTVTIRGIYYTMSTEQQEANQFDNTVHVSATTAQEGGSTIKSEAGHRVRSVANAIHFYQWAGHPIGIHRKYVYSQLTDAVKAKFDSNFGKFVMYTCQSDGTDYSWADVTGNKGTLFTASYAAPGRYLIYIKLYVDKYNGNDPSKGPNQKPDVLEDTDTTNDNVYDLIPVIFYVTDVEDSTIVLDYGLKAELTGEGGIYANDVVQPHSEAKQKIMGITSTTPSYMEYSWNNTTGTYQWDDDNRIDFTPASGNVIDSITDGEKVTTQFDGKYSVEDGKLYFTPTDFMDSTYTVYAAVSVYEKDTIPHEVGPSNRSLEVTPHRYDLDISKEVQMFQKVTVLPANVVYYEDDFDGISYDADKGSFITHTGSSDEWVQGVDQTIPYGQDPVYQASVNKEMSGNSLHTYHINDEGVFASFTFTGTGFEIISRTNAVDSGTMIVKVTDTATSEVVYHAPVITEFDNDANDASDDNNEVIYQVPVIRVDALALGTYHVEIAGGLEYDFDADKSLWTYNKGITQEQLADLLDNDGDANDGKVTGDGLTAWVKAGIITDEERNAICYDANANGAAYSIDERTQNTLAFLGPLTPPAYDQEGQMKLYIDGVRVFQPLAAEKQGSYLASEQGVTFSEMRELIMSGQMAFGNYQTKELTVSSAEMTWVENRDGKTYTLNYAKNVEQYLLAGPNNEVYMRRTGTNHSDTDYNYQILVFYVSEKTAGTTGTLQVAVRSVDQDLFLGAEAGSNVLMKFNYVKSDKVEETSGFVDSATEQYYTIDYTQCPTVTTADGKTCYQVVLLARNTKNDAGVASNGMVSFSSMKHSGLTIEKVVDSTNEAFESGTTWKYVDGVLYDTTNKQYPTTSPCVHLDLDQVSTLMHDLAERDVEPAPEVGKEPVDAPEVTPLAPVVEPDAQKQWPVYVWVVAGVAVAALMAGTYLLTRKYLDRL